MSSVLQGSALWLIQPPRKSKPKGPQSPTAIHSRSAAGSCARDWCPILHALLDFDGTASRLDEPDFAGVCPIASPDPADTKIRVREATAMRSRCRFVRKGLAPDASRLLDSGGAADRLDEPSFAGVCPTANPRSRRHQVPAQRGAQTGTRSVLLDSGSTAGLLNESSFAGVCPTASPRSRHHEVPSQRGRVAHGDPFSEAVPRYGD
jgi:hypothetical protein